VIAALVSFTAVEFFEEFPLVAGPVVSTVTVVPLETEVVVLVVTVAFVVFEEKVLEIVAASSAFKTVVAFPADPFVVVLLVEVAVALVAVTLEDEFVVAVSFYMIAYKFAPPKSSNSMNLCFV
jgi:hypothetical protein